MEQISDSIKEGQDQRTRTIQHIKWAALGLVSAGLLVLDWWLIRQAMFEGAPTSFWIWPILTTAVWIVAVSFFALANPDRITFFTFNAVGFVAFLVMMPRDIYIFFGGLLFFLISLLFQGRLQDEERNHLNFSIRRTLGSSQSVITYGLLALIGFMIYSNVRADFQRDPNVFYQRLGETAVKGLPYLAQDGVQYNLNQSLGDYFRSQASEQFPQFNQVSAEQQRQLLNQVQNEFSRQFGIDADENVSLRVAMVEVVTERLREGLGRFERFFPLLFTVLVVAALRSVAFVFNWAVLIISWVLFRLLLGARFIRLGKRTVEIETLEI